MNLPTHRTPSGTSAFRLLKEWPLWTSLATTLAFLNLGESLLADLSRPVRFVLVLGWLVLVILFSIFAVVRHQRTWRRSSANRSARWS